MIYCIFCVLSVVIGYALGVAPDLIRSRQKHENIPAETEKHGMTKEQEKEQAEVLRQFNNLLSYTGDSQSGKADEDEI